MIDDAQTSVLRAAISSVLDGGEPDEDVRMLLYGAGSERLQKLIAEEVARRVVRSFLTPAVIAELASMAGLFQERFELPS